MIFVGPGPKSVGAWVVASNRARPQKYTLSGVTRDATGAALGNCTVLFFETGTNAFRGSVISDANGNYTFDVNGAPGLTFFEVMYKVTASGDVSGTGLNTLQAAPS